MSKRPTRARRSLAVLLATVALVLVALPASASAQVRIRGVETTLSPAPVFSQTLSDNGYTLNVVSPAGPRPPLIVFPITSGRVGLVGTRRIRGFVNHAGGVAISRSGVSSALTNFKVTFTRRPFIGARSGVNRIKFLNLTTLRARATRTRLIVVADASLNVQGAVALNRAFSTTNFTTNLPVGQVTMEIRR